MALDNTRNGTFTAKLPVMLEVPRGMVESVQHVLDGEYEAGCFGENLTILDLGANVGSFSIWAHLRWPGSTIHCYEAHPGTFAILGRNVGAFANIHPVNAAVFPTEAETLVFAGRYDGDGESGIVDVLAATFTEPNTAQTFEVSATHPRGLPSADVVKVDIEGAELDVLRELDVSATELIVLEYQNDANREAIKALFEADFEIAFEDEFLWDEILPYDPNYRASLAGDHWGRLFFVRRELRKLRRLATPRSTLAEQDTDDPVPEEEAYDFGDGGGDYGFPDEVEVAEEPEPIAETVPPAVVRPSLVDRAVGRLRSMVSRTD